jgi:hypothetical protein
MGFVDDPEVARRNGEALHTAVLPRLDRHGPLAAVVHVYESVIDGAR